MQRRRVRAVSARLDQGEETLNHLRGLSRCPCQRASRGGRLLFLPIGGLRSSDGYVTTLSTDRFRPGFLGSGDVACASNLPGSDTEQGNVGELSRSRSFSRLPGSVLGATSPNGAESGRVLA